MSLNLPPRMQALLDALPPGADIFDYIQHVLDDEVFPSIPKAFWSQIWAAIVLLVLIVLAFGAGFAIRISRKRMKVIISDGQLTRPDPKLCVPILWTCVAICDIVLNLLVRSSLRGKHYPVVLGRFWMLLHLPLVVSYVLVGSNIVASTPAFRRYFVNMHRGAFWFNLGTIGISLAMCAGVVAPAVTVGSALRRASDGYKSAVIIVQEAKSAGNITQLLALQDILGDLEGAGRDHVTAIRDGNAIYAGYVAFFLLACIIPGFSLNRYVNHKISRLEQNKNPYSSRSHAETDSHKRAAVSLQSMQTDLPMHITPPRQVIPHTRLNFVPEQPKDRPFAHLVVVETPLLPARFNDILKDSTQSNVARVLRLRRALRIDMRFLVAYTLQLCAFGGMATFFCFAGEVNISMRQHLTLSLAFPSWNFIASGLFVSAASLYDALTREETEEASHALPLSGIPGQTTSKLSTIQCSQVIDIAYISERSEKRLKDMEDEELRITDSS